MNNHTKFETGVKLFIGLVFLMAIPGVFLGGCMNNKGATEKRALENAKKFAVENNLKIQRINCAGDSDGDGFGSCTIVTDKNEKIMLQCPSDWSDTKIWGATGCKEIFQNMNMMGGAVRSE
jgi:hypothetical protein